MPCGGPKKSPRTSSIVQVIFSFWSFEISEDILRTQDLLSVKIHFLTNVSYIWPHLDNTSLCIDYPAEKCKFSVILFGSMLPNLKRVTDETSIVETAVWPITFLINVFTALKGSQF